MSVERWVRSCSGCVPRPKHLAASRAARNLAGGDRQRKFTAWADALAERKAFLEKLRAATYALRNRPLRACYTTWSATAAELMEKRRKLEFAVRGIMNAKLRKPLNQWHDFAAEAIAQKAKLKAAMLAMSPEGRAMKAVLRRLITIAIEQKALRDRSEIRNHKEGVAVVRWSVIAARFEPAADLPCPREATHTAAEASVERLGKNVSGSPPMNPMNPSGDRARHQRLHRRSATARLQQMGCGRSGQQSLPRPTAQGRRGLLHAGGAGRVQQVA